MHESLSSNDTVPISPPNEADLSLEQKLICAADPATATLQLTVLLSQDQDAEVRRLIAENPNTPLESLLHLAKEFPEEFLNNPILPLIHLTQPDFSRMIAPETWLHLLRFEAVPLHWLQDLLTTSIIHQWNERTLSAAAFLHIHANNAATKAMEELEDSWNAIWFDMIDMLFSYVYPPDNWLPEMIAHPDHRFRVAAAFHPATSPAQLEQLLLDSEERVRTRISLRQDIPLHIIECLIADPSIEVRCNIARHPSLPEDIRWRLASDPEDRVREAVAQYPALSKVLLHKLATDPSKSVRLKVAEHPAATLELLTLPEMSQPPVRYQVLHHPTIPTSLLTQLANDPDSSIRWCVAANPATPPHLLMQLASEDSHMMRRAIVKNPNTPPSLLIQLATDPESSVRTEVAIHRHTPPEALKRLLNDYDESIRALAIWHPNLPTSLLTSPLVTRAAPQISEAAFHRLDKHLYLESGRYERENHGKKFSEYEATLQLESWLCNPDEETFQYLFKPNWVSDGVRQRLIERFLSTWTTWSWTWRQNLLDWHYFFARIALTEQWQAFFAHSPIWWERYILVMKPETRTLLLKNLGNDGNRYVRAAARWQLERRGQSK